MLKVMLFALLFAPSGVALYVFVLQKLCFTPASYCDTYNMLAGYITMYGNFVMGFVRPECVAKGPDDCIANALMIMFATLFVLGILLGLLIFHTKKGSMQMRPPLF